MLDGSIRQDGPFECTVLGIGRDPFTHRAAPEFKHVRFGESCNDWSIYPVHESFMGGVAVKSGQQSSAVTLRWDGRDYSPERVAAKPVRREAISEGPSMRVG